MREGDLKGSPVPCEPATPERDAAETMRRAIHAVAVAQRLVAESRARRDRRVSGRRARDDNRTPVEVADAAVADLRASVEAYVRPLRDAGAPPERVLVSLKAALHETPPTPDQPREERATLVRAAVGWGIAEYFRER